MFSIHNYSGTDVVITVSINTFVLEKNQTIAIPCQAITINQIPLESQTSSVHIWAQLNSTEYFKRADPKKYIPCQIIHGQHFSPVSPDYWGRFNSIVFIQGKAIENSYGYSINSAKISSLEEKSLDKIIAEKKIEKNMEKSDRVAEKNMEKSDRAAEKNMEKAERVLERNTEKLEKAAEKNAEKAERISEKNTSKKM